MTESLIATPDRRNRIRLHAGGGRPRTAAERAEAEGLLDIAEFFVVQRMRQRLAA